MQARFRFECALANGLHARPATALAGAAAAHAAAIELTNLRSGAVADAKSVLELVAAGVMHGDECQLDCSGPDAEQACRGMAQFIGQSLAQHDTPLPQKPGRGGASVPYTLRGTDAEIVTGIPASPGIGRGELRLVSGLQLPRELAERAAADPEVERRVADDAFRLAIDGLRTSETGNETAAQIRQALAALAADPALRMLVAERIELERETAAQAVLGAIEQFALRLRESQSEYLSARAADLADIAVQVLSHIPGVELGQQSIEIHEPTILAARSLAASQLLALDRTQLSGLVLGDAGITSHVVILSRSFGIPCVAGADIAALGAGGTDAVIDGARGILASPVTAAVGRYYERERRLAARIERLQAGSGAGDAATSDGHRIELGANISTAEEAEAALAGGAQGVGLFRTEMLYSTRDAEPSEDEQFDVYSRAAAAFGDRPVIIRTLDVGGDKPLAYLDLPAESNPFLGFRGIRIYLQHQALFRRQLRAIVRASAHGNLWVMAPMVSGLAEAAWFSEQVAGVQQELQAKGVHFNSQMPVGIMVEVPSAALVIDQLCDVVDFFSIGTNDLTQYLLAVERGNPQVAELYEELHPALVRMLGQVVEAAHAKGKWVGICGELARNPRYTPLLVGLGFDELSMSVPAIPAVRAAVAARPYADCRELARQALQCTSAGAILAELSRHAVGAAALPLLDAAMIELHSDCASKAEAIRELCALMYVGGRTGGIDELEDAVWAREETYATGLGHGFAIPHCKSSAVSAGSLAVLKLAEPVDWGSVDDKPVDVVLMLVMPEGDQDNRHLQVFAALARKLMHEEFRQSLRDLGSTDGIMSYLESELELKNQKDS